MKKINKIESKLQQPKITAETDIKIESKTNINIESKFNFNITSQL